MPVVLLFTFAVASAPGGTVDTFTGSNGDLTSPTNYSPGAPGNTSDVLLSTTATALTINAGTVTAESLTNSNGVAYTISNATGGATNSTLTLGNAAGFSNANHSSAANELLYVSKSGSSLTIQGSNSGNGTGTLGLVLASSGSFDATSTSSGINVSSNISQAAGVTAALSLTGTGTVTLSGTNTYTGTTNVSAGVLQINTGGSLPSSTGASVSVASGAQLLLYNPAATGTLTASYGVSGQTLTIDGAGAGSSSGALRVDSPSTSNISATLAGNINLGAGTTKITPTTGNFLFVTGSVTDNGNTLQKQGTGTLTLAGSGSGMTGSAIVGNGTLVLANTSGAAVSSTYKGVTITTTGTLLMGAANQLGSAVPVTLTGASGTGNAATFAVNGYSQGSKTSAGIGPLTLSASSVGNVIDFGSQAAVISFASLTTNSATLTINNYLNNGGGHGQSDQLIFDQNESANLGNIVFTGFGASTEVSLGNGFYEVYPIPEPGAIAGGLLTVALAGWQLRRRGMVPFCHLAGGR